MCQAPSQRRGAPPARHRPHALKRHVLASRVFRALTRAARSRASPRLRRAAEITEDPKLGRIVVLFAAAALGEGMDMYHSQLPRPNAAGVGTRTTAPVLCALF
jgi:hypothetical protein